MRSEPEPRRVRGLPKGEADYEAFYCAFCGMKFAPQAPYSVIGHVRGQHEVEDPTEGEDYVRGWQANLWEERHADWRRRQEWRAELTLGSIVGVDDFLLECGDV